MPFPPSLTPPTAHWWKPLPKPRRPYGEFLRALRRRGQRAGGGFQFGRGRRNGFDDHVFEVARDAVDTTAALDLGFRIVGGSLVGSLLGNQRILEHLQGVGHGADFRL